MCTKGSEPICFSLIKVYECKTFLCVTLENHNYFKFTFFKKNSHYIIEVCAYYLFIIKMTSHSEVDSQIDKVNHGEAIIIVINS